MKMKKLLVIFLSVLYFGLMPLPAENKISRIIDAGRGEKYSLLLSFQKGDVFISRLNMKFVTKMGQFNQALSMNFLYKISVVDVDQKNDDNALLEMTIENVELDLPNLSEEQREAIQSQMKEQLAALKDQKFIGSMNRYGKQSIVEMTPELKTAFDGLKIDPEKMLDDIYPDMPDQPLGIGGKWEINKTIDQNGLQADIRVVYTLEKAALLADGNYETTVSLKGDFQMQDRENMKSRGGLQGLIIFIPGKGKINSTACTTAFTIETEQIQIEQEIILDFKTQ